jgi:hypothetical protein
MQFSNRRLLQYLILRARASGRRARNARAMRSTRNDEGAEQFIDSQRVECYPAIEDVEKVLDVIDLTDEEQTNISCSICLEPIEKTHKPNDLGVHPNTCKTHTFHLGCFKTWYRKHHTCPICRRHLSNLRGYQPDGKQTITSQGNHFVVDHIIPNGIQKDCHPMPNKPYRGIHTKMYIPNTEQGKVLLKKLKLAWNRALLFRIGYNRDTKCRNTVIPNGLPLDIDCRTDAHVDTSIATLLQRLQPLSLEN